MFAQILALSLYFRVNLRPGTLGERMRGMGADGSTESR